VSNAIESHKGKEVVAPCSHKETTTSSFCSDELTIVRESPLSGHQRKDLMAINSCIATTIKYLSLLTSRVLSLMSIGAIL